MDRYLIETQHTQKDCLQMLDLLNAQGYLTHFDWGCKAGVHTGWAVIEAKNEAEALLVVPPLVRGQARVVKLNKFDSAMLDQLHHKA